MLVLPGGSSTAAEEPPLRATPQLRCNEASKPETDIQGRVPKRDYESGRAAKGYTCNARKVSRYAPADPAGMQRGSGGFKVFRYVDDAGHVCAVFDSTLMAPTDLPYNVGSSGTGTIVLDISDPKNPTRTANLETPAMQSPHESLYLNKRRGLLAAAWGNAGTAPGQVDIYDLSKDCRSPALQSSLPIGALGHESGFARDGKTYYVSSTGGQTLTAIDVTDPQLPRPITTKVGVNYHGLRLNRDGTRMYVADIGRSTPGATTEGGLTILDVSSIQNREQDPEFREISRLTWRQMSIPQAADPIKIRGHQYLLENDEFEDFGSGSDQPAAVGAARLINIDDERNPFVVSNLRLEVHQRANRDGPQRNDPGTSLPVQGYAGHYCSTPRYRNPGIVACSMIASGLRVFDIRDPYHPKEVAYFNDPTMPSATDPGREGGWAMSAPAYDLKRRLVYYSDGNSGFYAVRLAKKVVPERYWR